jgi:hypothetical protein
VLNKFNENFLKEMHGIATVNTYVSNYDSNFSIPNFNFEEETGLFSKNASNNDEFDLNSYSFIFDILSESFEVVIKDFMSPNPNETLVDNTLKQKHKLLGLKKIFELDYIKDILEIVINAESINYSNPKLNEIIEKAIVSNVFKKMIEYFYEHQWNNMYQKSFDNVVSILLNKYTNKKLAKNFFFECEFLDFITNNIFNRKLKFESGKEINVGIFSFLLETAYNVSKCENLFLCEILSENINWRNFINKFVLPIKDRFAKGMVFPQENPFQKASMNESSQSDVGFLNKESINEAIKNSTDYFLGNTELAGRKESSVSGMSQERKSSIFSEDMSHEYDKSDFYNNNYWRIEVKEIDFEIS